MEKESTWNKTNQWNDELLVLKNIIINTSLKETTKWGASVYTYKNKNIIGISGFKSYFGIWFFKGVFLKDTNKLLVNAQEGKTKSMRQMRFNSIKEINETIILDYIKEAIEVEEKGLKIEPSKTKSLKSAYLDDYFSQNPLLFKQFQELSVAKQNEFIAYIETAKQEKTKLTRLEKITPLIQQGVGLNDTYKKKAK